METLLTPVHAASRNSFRRALYFTGSRSDGHVAGISLSSLSSSWTSAESVDNEAFLRGGHKTPQHIRSCTDIMSSTHFQGEKEEVDSGFRVRRHGSEMPHQTPEMCRAHHKQRFLGQPSFSRLQKGHSKSEERLLLDDESGVTWQPWHGHRSLYKSSSLGRSLAFGNSADTLLGSQSPRRSASSVQLPSKGILKNKNCQGGGVLEVGNVRKVKSMEVLSSRVEWSHAGEEVARSKQEDNDLEKRKETARNSFVQEKLQFSAFLNEITRQVISPSQLSSLGVSASCEPVCTISASPKSQREEQKSRTGRQDEASRCRKLGSIFYPPDSFHPHPEKLCSHLFHPHHRSHSGVPHHHRPYPSGRYMDGASIAKGLPAQMPEENRCPQAELRFTSDSSCSSELGSRLLKYCPRLRQHNHTPHRVSHQASPGVVGQGLESCSDTSVSSHNRDSRGRAMVRSPVSEQSDKDKQTSNRDKQPGDRDAQPGDRDMQPSDRASTLQCQDAVFEVHRVQSLQEAHNELRHSLLRALLRMEHMEAELQETRKELGGLKGKFERLQDDHGGTSEISYLMGQKINSVVQSADKLNLLGGISELNTLPAAAHTNTVSLETINLLDHMDKSPVPRGDQSQAAEQEAHRGATVRVQKTRQQEVHRKDCHEGLTAFLPWIEQQEWVPDGKGRECAGAGSVVGDLLHSAAPEVHLNSAVEPALGSLQNKASLMKQTHRGPLSPWSSPARFLSTDLKEVYRDEKQPASTQNQDQSQHGHRPELVIRLHPGSAESSVSKDKVLQDFKKSYGGYPGRLPEDDLEHSADTVTYHFAQKMLDDFMQQLHIKESAAGDRDELLN